MRIGSVFSGIGGLELGLELAIGGEVVWQVEFDGHARRVLAKHWPDADRSVVDVKEAGAHNLAPVDLICGGFPCQDISTAGLGAGLEGAKSGLFFELARVIRELGPRYIVLENVAAITVRGLKRVTGTLAELGYDAEWGVLSAASVGAPHLRKRWYLIGWRNGLANPQSLGHNPRRMPLRDEQALSDVGGGGGQAAEVGDTNGARLEGHGGEHGLPARGGQVQAARPGADTPAASQRRAQSGVGRVVDGVPGGLDLVGWERGGDPERWERGVPRVTPKGPEWKHRLMRLGNAVVPQWSYEVGCRLKRITEGATK